MSEEISKAEPRKHGMTKAQWLQLWEDQDWRGEMVKTLHAVANCSHAEPMDRTMALRIWDDLIHMGMASVNPDEQGRTYAVVVRDVQVEILRGSGTPLSTDKRRVCHERMQGVAIMLSTLHQFLDLGEIATVTAALAQADQGKSSPGMN